MHILYVEDNPNDAKLIQRYIETTPHKLTVVPTIEAFEQLSPDWQSIHLVLADILINNQRSGFSLPRMLRNYGYIGEIIAVTALDSAQDKLLCAEAGFSTMLAKPFQMTTLANLLAQYTT